MFVDAIEKVNAFTRAIHSISRNYGSTVIQSGAATMFFINSDGWALTCNHVAKQLIVAKQLSVKRKAFIDELTTGSKSTFTKGSTLVTLFIGGSARIASIIESYTDDFSGGILRAEDKSSTNC